MNFAALGEGRMSELILTGPKSPAIAAADKELIAPLLKGDVKGAVAGGEPAIARIVMATHAGMTTGSSKRSSGIGLPLPVVSMKDDWKCIFPPER